ncbi:MAG: recombination regulator RecX [Treponema sp.]|jgi:regulatory protein|nr:recombination regulator RecX [Treponema sp.]
MQENPEYIKAEKTALRLITRAEQCMGGLARKLEKRGYSAACVNSVISRLCEMKLLDDSRFARLWLESRMRYTRTPRRLLSSLCARGIDRDDAEAAIKSVFDDEAEFALLTRFIKKHSRKKRGKNKGEADSRSLKYLLKNEGFSASSIRRYFEDSE